MATTIATADIQATAIRTTTVHQGTGVNTTAAMAMGTVTRTTGLTIRITTTVTRTTGLTTRIIPTTRTIHTVAADIRTITTTEAATIGTIRTRWV